ncbi:MAG: glycoside hydrolase family 11 protein [Spirochaetales bacterium]|nr:glycoside hydrolase family 11 protein [Spirochaetales bacterium]
MRNVFARKPAMVSVLALVICIAAVTGTAQTITSNSTGSQGGYWYTFWTDGGGSVSMTLGSGGQFSVNWSNCGNFVCGKGWQTGSESRTITWTANAGGAQYVGLYGWMQNPLVEYYIPRSGGSNRGTYQADGTTYTLYTNTRTNMPSIEGTRTFEQYFCGGGGGGSVNFGEHCNGWRKLGMGVGSQNYQVVAIEGWGGSSGSASATVGDAPSQTAAPTPDTTPSPSPLASGNIVVRARGTIGGEIMEVRIGNNVLGSWTVTTDYQDYYAQGDGTIDVYFTNDDQEQNGMDLQVDYITYNGTTYQAEDQAVNTGVYNPDDDSCGGSYSDLLECNGYIRFEVAPVTPDPTQTPISTTPPTATPLIGDCNVSFYPVNSTQALNSTFRIDVIVNSGSQALAAYGFTITYNPDIMSVVEVAEGADGFIAAENTGNPGEIIVSGFETSPTGPGSSLQVLVVTFNAVAEGISDLGLYVDELIDADLNTIGTACGIGGSVEVTDEGILGDANGDGEIDIRDALVTAQYYVGLAPANFIPAAADTNCDGAISIVDALVIAQYYVGLVDGFCL